MDGHTKSGDAKEIQMPEWEHIAAQQDGGKVEGGEGAQRGHIPLKTRVVGVLDKIVSPHRTYFGRRRRTFLLVLLGIFLALLVFIIGLAVGLSHRGNANLPLPSNTKTFTGDLTYYEPGLGACGETSTSSDRIAAVSHLLFDAAGSTSSHGGNSNGNPLCGRMIRVQRFDASAGETRSVDLKVVDRCTGCAADDIDTTESVFKKLASIEEGRVPMTWAWLQ
ncbi:hypothetical protein FE78DRAFT_145509 [Lecanosticta acicola]|uniref:RlpA-like protein double-psi beta-barrel domain-containing protein n=1 Tax=Lecanosticta acicola TaxID=111012 RepID=A0AAI9EER0_9PEZI|nr:hypothetical protein FE78DRAFT_145509 [Lecanosticta acicola]